MHSAGATGALATHVRVGEGMVGDIAVTPRVLSLSWGAGEEAPVSLAGGSDGPGHASAVATLLAPVLDHEGRVLGVLQAVNKRAPSGSR